MSVSFLIQLQTSGEIYKNTFFTELLLETASDFCFNLQRAYTEPSQTVDGFWTVEFYLGLKTYELTIYTIFLKIL